MALAEIMRASCRKRLVTNYLIDGRFSYDDDFIIEHINTLAENRRLTVILYLSNGAAQRRSDKSVPNAFAAGISSAGFRSRIVSDKTLRDQYRGVVQRAMNIKAQVPSEVRFIFVPGLEDNLSLDAFRSMLALTQEVAGKEVDYARSACGCSSGSDTRTPSELMKEAHTGRSNHGVWQGIVTNDGVPFRFAYERSNGASSLAKLNKIEEASKRQGNAFIFWTSEYQGLPTQGKKYSTPTPNKRNYAMPTARERNELIMALR